MSIAAGTRLGRYEICSKLGEGGMGEVYLTHDTQLDRAVALRVLSNRDWGQACDLRFSVTRHCCNELGASALESQNRKPDPVVVFRFILNRLKLNEDLLPADRI